MGPPLTTASNSEQKNHIKEVKIPQNAEVGWKLIKKEQTFDELLREVYKKVPNHSELDIFRHANAHISDLQDLNLNKKIKPGQIILITNKKNSPELTEHKKLALEAEHIFQRYSRDKNFDPIFFANNFELLLDYLSFAQQVQVARLEYLKTVDGHKESYCDPITLNPKVESVNSASLYSAETKPKLDDLKFQTANIQAVNKLSADLKNVQAEYENFLKDKKLRNNSASHKRFIHQKHDLYQKLNTALMQNFSISHENKDYARVLRNVVKDTSGVRGSSFMGGLKLNVKAMEDIAKASISLKVGGYLVLGYVIADAGHNIYGAYQTDDMNYTVKVTVNESSKIVGGIAGGWAGAYLGGKIATGIAIVLGVATGGTAIVVIGGIGAVVGGVSGGYYGTIKLNEKVNEHVTKIC